MSTLPRNAKILLYVFFLSGISGLIYETVWLRMLTRVLGSTVYATSVTLSAFMAGLALGSWLLGRIGARRNPLRLYAGLEVGIGLAALLMLWAIPATTRANLWLVGLTHGVRGSLTFAQSLIMFCLLLLPTLMMGGTLPVLAGASRFFGTSLARRMGLLYGLNTLGAVSGVLLSGLFTLGSLGESGTVFIGVAVNFAVAFTALQLGRPGEDSGAEETPVRAAPSFPEVRFRSWIPGLYAVSGFVAIGYEVVWTRIFQIQIGTSIYAFALMLAFYLLGIGAGSLAGGRYVDRFRNPMAVFVVSQGFIAIYGLVGMYIMPCFNPVGNSGELFLWNAFVMPPLVVLPLTFALGFIFPALSRAYAVDPSQVSRDIGKLYALNTAGCILGSLAAGFLLLGWLGSRGTLLALAGANLILGWVGLALGTGRLRRPAAALFAVTLLGGLLASRAPDAFLWALDTNVKKENGEYARNMSILFHRESAQATTTAFLIPVDNAPRKNLWVNGIGMTRLCTETKIMAHLPILFHPDPKRFLAICFGMGTSLRSASRYPGLHCDAVELDPQVLDCFRFFHDDAAEVRANPRVHLYADDGRNFLTAREDRWDIITIDPPPPSWSAGAVNIQSREFFQLCRQHLNEKGIMCLWVPPMPLTEGRMLMATFREAFPATLVFRGPQFPGIYLLGLKTPEGNPIEVFRARAADPVLAPIVQADLLEWDRIVPDPHALEALLVLGPRQLAAFTAGVDVITDDHPYSEFPLWRSSFDRDYRLTLTGDLLVAWRDQVYAGRPRAVAPGLP